jgi:hypothetical protein
MNTVKKEKKWQEDLKVKIKKLKERAKEEPKSKEKIIYANVSGKPVVIEKGNHYAEIKLPEEKFEKKPEIAVKIEKENHYAVIKPIVDNIKERAKEELHEEKIKEEKVLQEEEVKKIEVSREKAAPTKLGSMETTIDRLIDIIDKKGSVNTYNLSKELGVSMERIESWAKILEDRGLIEIEYPLIGPSKLRKKEWKKGS